MQRGTDQARGWPSCWPCLSASPELPLLVRWRRGSVENKAEQRVMTGASCSQRCLAFSSGSSQYALNPDPPSGSKWGSHIRRGWQRRKDKETLMAPASLPYWPLLRADGNPKRRGLGPPCSSLYEVHKLWLTKQREGWPAHRHEPPRSQERRFPKECAW